VRRERLRERNLREQAGVDGSPRLPRARESLSLERIDVPAVDAPRRKRSPHEPIELPLARVPLDLVGRLAGKEEMVASGRDPRTPPGRGEREPNTRCVLVRADVPFRIEDLTQCSQAMTLEIVAIQGGRDSMHAIRAGRIENQGRRYQQGPSHHADRSRQTVIAGLQLERADELPGPARTRTRV